MIDRFAVWDETLAAAAAWKMQSASTFRCRVHLHRLRRNHSQI